MHLELNIAHPLHPHQMLRKALAVHDSKMFDEETLAASGPLGTGYLTFYDHRPYRVLNVMDPEKKIFDTHTFGIGAPPKAYAMTRHIHSTALNFPLRILIQERLDGRANIVYDIPSSQIAGKAENPGLAKAADTADRKLDRFVHYIACGGPAPPPIV